MELYANANVIVPVDFSPEADKALGAALQIVAAPRQITVVHVAQPISAFEPGVIFTATDASRREYLLETIKRRYFHTAHKDIQLAVLFGNPGQEIADYASRVNAGLIVMPSHGRTSRERLLIGSVAERVIRLAHCPVLVLRD